MYDIKLTFYGVRGSYPVSGKRVARFGGNTSSILIETDDQPLILDAGTGIIEIGNYFQKKLPQLKKISIFLSHFHTDHIQGLPFFKPMYDNEFEIDIYGFENAQHKLSDTVYSLFKPPLSPIEEKGVKAKINFRALDTDHPRMIPIGHTAVVEYIREDHPLSGVLVYRIAFGQKHIVYSTDVETPEGFKKETLEFITGADALIHDSMYFDKDYNSSTFSKKGFGHSTVSMAVSNAIQGNVKKLFLFHYNPDYPDRDIVKMREEAKKRFKNTFLSEESRGFKLRR
ncbi:MAG: MBL fold metallo-hydrolase [Candidatus Omnitrophota bacterium]